MLRARCASRREILAVRRGRCARRVTPVGALYSDDRRERTCDTRIVQDARAGMGRDPVERSGRRRQPPRHLPALDPRGRHGIPPQIARVRALYALTEPDGVVRASCAFTLGFDPKGEIPRDFALPLRELALNSGDGPDLGAGPIRLAHARQCSIPWHAERLWGRSASDLLPYLAALQGLLRRRLQTRAADEPERRRQVVGRRATDVPNVAPTADEKPVGARRTSLRAVRDQPARLDAAVEVAADQARRRAARAVVEEAFGDEDTLNRAQLARGRRLAVTGEHLWSPKPTPAREGTRILWSGSGATRFERRGARSQTQVDAIHARHRAELSVLRNEIELLRRRLRAQETS